MEIMLRKQHFPHRIYLLNNKRTRLSHPSLDTVRQAEAVTYLRSVAERGDTSSLDNYFPGCVMLLRVPIVSCGKPSYSDTEW